MVAFVIPWPADITSLSARDFKKWCCELHALLCHLRSFFIKEEYICEVSIAINLPFKG